MRWIKDRKTQIECLWCFLGGFCSTVLLQALEPGYFSWWRNIGDLNKWDFNLGKLYAGGWTSSAVGENVNHFIFGFIVTLILIWSIKVYRRL